MCNLYRLEKLDDVAACTMADLHAVQKLFVCVDDAGKSDALWLLMFFLAHPVHRVDTSTVCGLVLL